MPFNFPIAQNRFGDLFAEGISNALNTYRQGQQLQRQKTLTELQSPGFHFGKMPTVEEEVRNNGNQTIPSSSADTSTVIRGATDPALTPSALPLHITSPSVSVGQPNQFQSTISSALSSMPRSQRNAPASSVDSRYIPLSGGYLDTQEMMNRLLPQMMLNARGKFFESQAEAAGKASGDPSEVGLRTAQTNLAQRNAGTPRLGDPNYNSLMGGVAAAQADAKVPAAVATAAGSANATLPAKKDLAQYTSDLTEGREGRLLGLRIKEEAQRPTLGLAAANAFRSQNEPLVNTVNNYAQAKTAISEARTGNPAALKSALLSFAATADPKAQLRQGVMHEVMQVDPSFKGTLEMWLDKRANGQIPPRVLDAMDRMVDRVHQTNASMYEQRRQAYVSQNPVAATFIPETSTIFQVPGTSAPRNPYR